MTNDNTILVTQTGGIARITLNRPDRLNSFTRAMHAELAKIQTPSDCSRSIHSGLSAFDPILDVWLLEPHCSKWSSPRS